MRLVGWLADHLRGQGRDQIRGVREAVGHHADHRGVRQQRQGEWMTPTERDQPGMKCRGNRESGQQVDALGVVERAELPDTGERAPTEIGAPRRRGGFPADQHDHAVRWQRRDKGLPDPGVQREQPVVAIDQQHERIGGSSRVARAVECLQETHWAAVDVTPIQGDNRPARCPGRESGTDAAGWSCRCLPARG